MNQDTSHFLMWLAAFPLAFLASQFVLAPIVIYFKQTIAVSPTVQQTRFEQLSEPMRRFLRETVTGFGRIGFVTVENVHLPNAVPGIEGIQLLMVNRQTCDLVVAIIARSRQNIIDKPSMVMGIRSEFADGSRIMTGMNPKIGHTPQNPRSDYQNFPWASDPEILYEAHKRRLAAKRRNAEPRVAPAPGQELAYLYSDWNREMSWMVESGYRTIDAGSRVARFTLKGALLSTWKLAQPVKFIRIAVRNLRARVAWRKLGMAEYLRPAAPSAVDAQRAGNHVIPTPRGHTDETNGWIKCPHCTQVVPAVAAYCGACGYPVRELPSNSMRA